MDFPQFSAQSPGTPVRSPASQMFKSPGSHLGSPSTPFRRHRVSSYGDDESPLRSPPDLGPDAMIVDSEEADLVESRSVEPRLVIRKLVLINYKSYAGRQEIGPFNENFTAIVGPNGSGKSNIIDSLLFAFGFRAKKMRQDKLTGLIHKSDQHPNLPFARVEVHFETTGVPDSELRLAREVRRDGSNFYALNEKRATYAEVTALLEQRGIDLRHKRFLILQGEVESISLMPPKAENNSGDGLLEYLEDIIGTANYKMRIEELDVEKEQLRSDATDKQDRAQIVYRDIEKLEAERSKIERFLTNQNHGIFARSNLYQLRAYRLKNALQISQTEIDEQRAAIAAIEQEVAAKQQRINELNAETTRVSPEIAGWTADLKKMQARLKEAKLKEVKMKQQLEQTSKRLKRAERELVHARTQRQQSELWLANFSSDSVQLTEKLKEINARRDTEQVLVDEMAAELQESTQGLQEKLQQLQAKAEPWRAEIAKRTDGIEQFERQLANLAAHLNSLQEKEQEVTAQAEQIIHTGKQTRREFKELGTRHEELVHEQQQTERKIAGLAETRDKARAAVDELRPEVSAAREARATSQSSNRIESQLMSLKIPGLYGRLGSLGSIDQKYDIAVSTAAPELNNFVVDTPKTATRCIEELRKRSIGRAKFLVLDKLRQPRESNPKEFPAPRLIDLVSPLDPKFLKAFYSALGDTLVVDTPANARQTAFGGARRHRVVTLGGILISNNGAMSGGGAPLRGLMAEKVSAISSVELEDLEKRLASANFELAEARQELATAQARAEELAVEIPRAATELSRAEMSLKQQEAQMGDVKKRRRALKDEIAELNAQLQKETEEVRPQIERLTQERSKFEASGKPVENEIEALQQEILNAGGLRFRDQKAKVAELEERARDVQRQLTEGQENFALEQSRVKKLASDIARYEEELRECTSVAAPKAESDDIPSMEAEVQRLSVLLDQRRNEIDTAKNECAETRKEIDDMRASEIGMTNGLQKLVNAFNDRARQLKDFEAKLRGLVLNDLTVAQSLEKAQGLSKEAEEEPLSEEHLEHETREGDEARNGARDDSSEARGDHASGHGEVVMKTEDDEQMDDAGPSIGASVPTALVELSPDEIESLDESELKRTISESDRFCEAQSGDMRTLEKYRQRFFEYQERKAVSDEAVAKYEAAKDELQSLTRRRFNEFMDGFRQISAKLKELYQLITMGGNAELELVDSMDPFAEGILFSVMPPRKSWRNIANLSGGEKTLSSLALVFALHHYKPTPLYVMDEIDAALDFRNVSIIANYIKERTKDGQFIVISLRNNMFELASRLVGVYKVDNMTRSVALQTS